MLRSHDKYSLSIQICRDNNFGRQIPGRRIVFCGDDVGRILDIELAGRG